MGISKIQRENLPHKLDAAVCSAGIVPSTVCHTSVQQRRAPAPCTKPPQGDYGKTPRKNPRKNLREKTWLRKTVFEKDRR